MRITKIDNVSHFKNCEGELIKDNYFKNTEKHIVKEIVDNRVHFNLGRYIKKSSNATLRKNKEVRKLLEALIGNITISLTGEVRYSYYGKKDNKIKITIFKEIQGKLRDELNDIEELDEYMKKNYKKSAEEDNISCKLTKFISEVIEFSIINSDTDEMMDILNKELQRIYDKNLKNELSKKIEKLKKVSTNIEKSIINNRGCCTVNIGNNSEFSIYWRTVKNLYFDEISKKIMNCREDYYSCNYKLEDWNKEIDDIILDYDIENFSSELETLIKKFLNLKAKKSKALVDIKNIKNIYEIYQKKKLTIEHNIFENKEWSDIKKYGELTKGRFLKKWISENFENNEINFDEEKLKSLLYIFIDEELAMYLKRNFYTNKYSDTYSYYCKYETIKDTIKNQLRNKLINHIILTGKIIKYYSKIDDLKIKLITSRELKEIRINEAFVRNIIGAITLSGNNLTNIINPNETGDMIGIEKRFKKNLEDLKDIAIMKSRQRFKLFFDCYYDDGSEIILTDDKYINILSTIRTAINEIRKNAYHFKILNPKELFSNNGVAQLVSKSRIETIDSLKDFSELIELFNNSISEYKIKSNIYRQLDSSKVISRVDQNILKNILKDIKIEFGGNNFSFTPSFKKIWKRGIGLAQVYDFEIYKDSISYYEVDRECLSALYYLLKLIYENNFKNIFLEDKIIFKISCDEVISKNKNDKRNSSSGNYRFVNIPTFTENMNIRDYFSNLQSNIMMSESKDVEENNINIFIDFLQCVFAHGFDLYIKENYGELLNKNNFNTELLNFEIETNRSEIIDLIEFKSSIPKATAKNINFWLFTKLQNNSSIGNLKNELIKYKEKFIEERNLFSDEISILSIVEYDNDKLTDNIQKRTLDSDIKNSLSKKYVDKIEKFTELEFKDPKIIGIYTQENGNQIFKKSFDKMDKNCSYEYMCKLVSLVSDSKVNIYDLNKFKLSSHNIDNYKIFREDLYKLQKELHNKWVKEGKKFKETEKYKTIVTEIQNYQHTVSKVNMNNLGIIQEILIEILSRFVGYTSIWERDLEFMMRCNSYYNNENQDKIGKVFEKGNLGRTVQEYYDENKKYSFTKNIMIDNSKIDIRNDIAHIDYFPDPKNSILLKIYNLRKLMEYDRKLKNAVTKSVIQILEKYGFELKFDIDSNHIVKIKFIKSKEIKHLGNKNITTKQNSKILEEMIKKAFEM